MAAVEAAVIVMGSYADPHLIQFGLVAGLVAVGWVATVSEAGCRMDCHPYCLRAKVLS